MKNKAKHAMATLMDLKVKEPISNTPPVNKPIFFTTKITNDPRKDAPLAKMS